MKKHCGDTEWGGGGGCILQGSQGCFPDKLTFEDTCKGSTSASHVDSFTQRELLHHRSMGMKALKQSFAQRVKEQQGGQSTWSIVGERESERRWSEKQGVGMAQRALLWTDTQGLCIDVLYEPPLLACWQDLPLASHYRNGKDNWCWSHDYSVIMCIKLHPH